VPRQCRAQLKEINMTKKVFTLSAFLLAGALIGSAGVTTYANAATPLVASNGMTLYIFDKDVGGVPSCYKDCAALWPPALAKTGDKMGKGWTTVKRTDGAAMQWAYDKHPLYFYASDKKKGDKMGDGVGGVWHAAVAP
jgi:predicted lipoprotein with Yx(FWY)xxD motif